jgi:fido (protein-threonine AMPylation protein)
MTRDRSSEADEPVLVQDAQEIARIEAENTLRQFDAAMRELSAWIGKENYRLKPSTLLRFNRIALNRLSKYAGVFRPSDIKISGSKHQPVESSRVPELIEEFCDYVNDNWHSKSPIHLAAYAMWRLNWIHPFVDGNGRTSRIVSYLILCSKLGYRLPGMNTIPEQIASNKTPYYKALEAADEACQSGRLDVGELEKLIDAHLAVQLLEVHNTASGTSKDRSAVAEFSDDDLADRIERNQLRNLVPVLISHIESHPVIYSGAFVIVAALITVLLA